MDRNEFESLPKADVGNVELDVSDLDNQSDRTLFHAYVERDGQRIVHHSYVKDCFLNVLIHDLQDNILGHWRSRELPAKRLVPDAVLHPSFCDYEASAILLTAGADIRFQGEYKDLNLTQFYGYLHEELLEMKR
ncbi:hypothetical protein RYA05_04665 [Pseudomonas syringae pv. actinidiae]|nr:hypothetical protein [Pseudomonas syringae pv. actinidiae]